jgi:hypothetical protein
MFQDTLDKAVDIRFVPIGKGECRDANDPVEFCRMSGAWGISSPFVLGPGATIGEGPALLSQESPGQATAPSTKAITAINGIAQGYFCRSIGKKCLMAWTAIKTTTIQSQSFIDSVPSWVAIRHAYGVYAPHHHKLHRNRSTDHQPLKYIVIAVRIISP